MDFREYEKEFTAVRERLEALVYTPAGSLAMEAYWSKEPLPFERRTEGRYFLPAVGETWGELFDCAWFHFTGSVPGAAAGSRCVAQIDFSGEGLVYTSEGEILQGLTSATSRNEFPLGLWGKKTVELTDCAVGGEQIDLWVDAGCNDVEGQYKNDGRVKEACVAVLDPLCRGLFYDWVVCQSLYVGLCENNDPYGEEIRPVLCRAAETLKEINKETMQEAREILSEILNQKNEDSSLTYSSIGHSHLDLLFLWPLRETVRKAARTYSTVLKMMERYPEYKFVCSQAPVYAWMKQYYPSLYERILERIREGRWEVQGAFFIECDTNLPCGESLVRQLLYGKQFFKKEFGADVPVGFLPDVFGYSGALPQLLVKSGTPYFMTQKLSMNDTNRFPRHTFWWEGIDGSKVLTHMLPEDSYCSAAVPQMAIYGLHHNKDLDVCDSALQLFGLGDGGGGAGYEHFERKRRMKDLKGCPPHRDEFVADFFRRIEANQKNYRSWKGELYFERHQGTYTSIAKSKKYNRLAEQNLHTLEWVSVLAEIKCRIPYPAEEIKRFYQEILLYQFHDCLPGSSIRRVYDESHARYEIIAEEIGKLTGIRMRALAGLLAEDGIVCFNPAPVDREEYADVFGKEARCKLPAYGISVVSTEGAVPWKEEKTSQKLLYELENSKVLVRFTERGTVSELILKENGFNLIRKGEEGNRLVLYPDELTHWDINKEYLKAEPEEAVLTAVEPFTQGGAVGIRFEFAVGSSVIRQRVIIRKNSARLDFETEVEWKEEYKMLRAQFPVSVVTDHAVCEIQFGHLARPTHTNTSWEEAKFEACAHKWTDMADPGGGLALLNNCKYGYKLWDNTLDLCLLRSQNCPCEQGDYGHHEFTYSAYPHTGDVISGGVVKEGYRLNYPLLFVETGKSGKTVEAKETELTKGFGLVECDRENIVLETVKKAEDGNGYIFRFYEAAGMHTKARFRFSDFLTAALCDLLEQTVQTLERKGELELEFHAFEVHTLRVRVKEPGL